VYQNDRYKGESMKEIRKDLMDEVGKQVIMTIMESGLTHFEISMLVDTIASTFKMVTKKTNESCEGRR